MQPSARPRRSALYMPASNARAVEKARQLPCDVVILDLEDAVAPEMKPQARDAAVAAVKAGGFGRREVVIRVNGLSTPWGADDLAAAAEAGPDAVVVPKVNGAADVATYDAALKAAPARTMLWAMIETCPAMFALDAIGAASASTRLAAFVMGVNDLAKEMKARQTPGREAFLPVSQPVGGGRARPRPRHPRRRAQRDRRPGGAGGGVPPGRRFRLRRQEPDPPEPPGHLQPRVRAARRGGRLVSRGGGGVRGSGERGQAARCG